MKIDDKIFSTKDIDIAYSIKEGSLKYFWEKWLLEYLRNLPPVDQQKAKKCKPILVGTLALVHQDNITRVYWPIGRITKVYPGKDGIVRSVDLLLTDGKTLK